MKRISPGKGVTNEPIDINQLTKDMDSRVWVYDMRGVSPVFQVAPADPVITEDIDCEIIEPAKLPPPSPDAQ